MLNKVLVMKLSGSLGTGKGCKGPKTLVNIRNENTFLDLAVKQIEHLNKTYDADVHLVSITSFNMDGNRKKFQKYFYIECNHCCGKFYAFHQSRYWRINKESLLSVTKLVTLQGMVMSVSVSTTLACLIPL